MLDDTWLFYLSNNRKVLTKYSDDTKRLLKRGYRPKERPSGHRITHKFTEQAGAIPPNLLMLGNDDSNGYYVKRCAEEKIKRHPARFPVQLLAFFIKFFTDEGDMVLLAAVDNANGAPAVRMDVVRRNLRRLQTREFMSQWNTQ